MHIVFFTDIMHNAVPKIAEKKWRCRHQKNLLHRLLFRASAGHRAARLTLFWATGAFRSGTLLTLLSARTSTAGFALFARITLIGTRYARFAFFCFLYFIHMLIIS